MKEDSSLSTMESNGHYLVSVLAAFIALTAIGGGSAMLTGLDQFPLAWLHGTPFRDYAIPALILALVVGGSALAAAITIVISDRAGMHMSLAAGLIMAGYIAGEVLLLPAAAGHWIEALYFGPGLVIVGLAAYLWRSDRRHQRGPGRQRSEAYP